MLCAVPIEIESREMDGALLLALELAKRGLPTLLGERMVNQYIKKHRKPVIYFDIDQHRPTNEVVVKSGGKVLNVNTEGFGFIKHPPFCHIFENIDGVVDRICVWGEKQKEILAATIPPNLAELLTVTGFVPFDLANEKFLPYYHSQEISQEYGDDLILINTNFSAYNHAMERKKYLAMLQKMDEWDMYNDSEYLENISKNVPYQKIIISMFVDMAKQLATKYPQRDIIIRPHPVENSKLYKDLLSHYSNIHVTNKGSVRQWIASASAVIHHDCTTSLEALMMGKKVIQFRPIFDEDRVEHFLADIGIKVKNVEELFDIIDDDVMQIEAYNVQLEKMAPNLANLELSATKSLADIAAEYANEGTETWIPKRLSFIDNIKCWRKHLSKLLRSKQPGHNGRKVSYALSKFPRLPFSSVQERVEKLQKIDPSLPNVILKELALNTFLVQPK